MIKIGDIVTVENQKATVIGFREPFAGNRNRVAFYVLSDPTAGEGYNKWTLAELEPELELGKGFDIDFLDFSPQTIYSWSSYDDLKLVTQLQTCVKCGQKNPCRDFHHICFKCRNKQ